MTASGDLSGTFSKSLGGSRRGLKPAVAAPISRIFSAPSFAIGSWRLTLSAAATAAGLFTLSWERLANVPVGPFNLKIAVVLFAVSLLLNVAGARQALARLWRAGRSVRVLLVLLGLVLLWFIVRAAFAVAVASAAAQVLSVFSGAVVPALAVLGVVSTRSDLAWVLRWLISGGIVASVFGLYQLVAFYLGWPQGVAYTGIGAGGSAGRIAAFSYEPAYFAYFLVLILGAVATQARLRGMPVRWSILIFLSAVLALVNVRALLFTVPLLAVLLAGDWTKNRKLLARGAVAAVLGCAFAFAAPLGVSVVDSALHTSSTSGSSTQQVPAGPTSQPVKDDSPGPSEAGPEPLPQRVLDPAEKSSNGPRLDLYRAVLRVDASYPIVGVGPGGLRGALAAVGYHAPNQGGVIVANNIWLQAGADGGLILVAIELLFLSVLGVLWWLRRGSPEQPLFAALLAVLLVGGMLTSYFFDIKVWIVLVLALSGAVLRRERVGPDVPEMAS